MSFESISEAQKLTFQRWQQAFSLWSEAQKNYFEPDVFCVNMQTCITQIRTISFILQSNKDKIDSFEQWYTPWQEKMQNDHIMKWLKDSRNKIEKQGDLEKYSNIQIEMIASYLNNGPKVIIPSKKLLFQGISIILSDIKKTREYKHFKENGILVIKRQWFANNFENVELLSLLSYGLLFLLDVINSLYPNQQLFKISDYRESLLKEPPRVLYISLKTGKLFCNPMSSYHNERFFTDENLVKTRYPLIDNIRTLPQNSLYDYVIKYMQIAKHLLKIDKSLEGTVFLSNMFENGKLSDVYAYPIICANRQTKYLFMRFIAQQVKIYKLNTMITIAESWLSTRTDLDPITVLTDFPKEKEAILVTACNMNGEEYTCQQEFTRKDSDIVFVGEPVINSQKDKIFFISFVPRFHLLNHVQ